MIMYEEISHSRTQSFLYIESFRDVFSLASLYMGAKAWYVSRLAETYTRIPDLYRTMMVVVTL